MYSSRACAVAVSHFHPVFMQFRTNCLSPNSCSSRKPKSIDASNSAPGSISHPDIARVGAFIRRPWKISTRWATARRRATGAQSVRKRHGRIFCELRRNNPPGKWRELISNVHHQLQQPSELQTVFYTLQVLRSIGRVTSTTA